MYDIFHTPRGILARRLTAIPTMLVLASILFAGCAATTTSTTGLAQNQTFIYPNKTITGQPQILPNLSLDPAYLIDYYSQNALNLIQSQLVTLNTSLQVIPDAAQSFTPSNNDQTWTFVLRPGLEWSDGTPLTSYDFAAGIQHDLDPKLCTLPTPETTPNTPFFCSTPGAPPGQPQATFLRYIKGTQDYWLGNKSTISGIQTPDGQTIIFNLTQPVPFFPDQMATTASIPLERSAYHQYKGNYILHFSDSVPVAQSGPFIIAGYANFETHQSVSDPTKADEIIFKPNPHWWGKQLTLSEVDMPIISQPDDQFTDYSNGQINYAEVPPEQYANAKDLPDFHEAPWLNVEFVGMNLLNAPFDNLQLRQALDLSLNKQYLVDSVLHGGGIPTNHIIPLGLPGYNTSLLSPPDTTTGTAALTGNQQLAQQMITTLANNCVNDYTADCKYIVGTPPLTTPINQIDQGCPLTFKVGKAQAPIVLSYIPNEAPIQQIAEGIAQQWLATLCLNASAAGNGFNPSVGAPAGAGQTPLWLLGYSVDYADPEDYTSLQFDPSSSGNYGNFGETLNNQPLDSQVQSLITQMRTADTDLGSNRLALYSKLEQELVDQALWVPVYQRKLIYRLSPYVENFYLPPNAVISDQEWTNIAILAH